MDTVIGTVPPQWPVVPLGTICDIQVGPSSVRKSDRTPGGAPMITPPDIQGNQITADYAMRIDPTMAQRLDRYRVRIGDLVMVRVGDIHRHAAVQSTHAGAILGSSCLRLRAHPGLLPGYLTCYLAHPGVQDWLDHHANQGIVPTVSTQSMYELPVPLPPQDAQTRIADLIQTIDEQIRLHEQITATTRSLRELLIPHLLTGALPAAG
jgi:Type I restriction modification DNA specificity domain